MPVRADAVLALLDPGRLWSIAMVVVPLSIVVAAVGMGLPRRPGLRHMLWASLLALLACAPLLPSADMLGAPRIDAALVTRDAAPSPHRDVARIAVAPPPSALRDGLSDLDAYPSSTFADRVAAHRTAGVAPPSSAAAGPDRTAPAPIEPVRPPIDRVAAADHSDRPRATAGAHARTEWSAFLSESRDLIAHMPAMPPEIWAAGIAVLVVVVTARWIAFRGLLATARPAPADVQRIVLETAERIGVRRRPRTVLSDRRISPLVTCGPRPLLVLPRPLWNALDDDGRRAVVMHELAHLRRHDHRLAWLDVVVGILYWWHPVVWWIRRRLRDEADLACDAWVTALLPHARRAYATALLHARSSSSDVPRWVPTLALGEHARKTRFARRITMVMTQNPAPRATLAGAATAVALAVAGWIAAPSIAAASPDGAPVASPRPAPAAEAPARPDSDGLSADEREELERRLAEIGAQLEARLAEAMEKLEQALAEAGQDGDLRELMGELEIDPERIRAQAMKAARDARQQAMELYRAAKAQMRAAEGAGAPDAFDALRQRGAPAPGARPQPAPEVAGEVSSREYRLSGGKLEAFTGLMVREDVPILVSPGEDGITIHATPQQHRIIGAFLDLLEGRDPRLGRAAPRADAPLPSRPGAIAERVDGEQVLMLRRVMEEERQHALRQHREDGRRELEGLRSHLREVHARHGEAQQHLDQVHARLRELEQRMEGTRRQLDAAADPQAKREILQAIERLGRAIVDLQNERAEAEFMMRQSELEADTIAGELERVQRELEVHLDQLEREIRRAGDEPPAGDR